MRLFTRKKADPPLEADLTLISQARLALAKRRFGQNFLTSSSVLDGIVRCLSLSEQDTVVEIGPGLGFLTERLLAKAKRVVAVELEHAMVSHLCAQFPDEAKLEIVAQDFLAFPLASVLKDRPAEVGFKVVGNIPYNITSKVLLKFTGALTDREPPEEAEARKLVRQVTLMVQKEVAERIAAKPGTKAYSPLTIAVQLGWEPWLEFVVPPTAFHPRPGVDSAVVSLVPRVEPLVNLHDPAFFTHMVRTLFQQRRKTIKNTLPLAANVSLEQALAGLQALGINPQVRPETLDIATLGALANVFHAGAR